MAGARIEAIDKGTIHKICSGQVVLDLAAAVKELVENSLDAGASSIEIKLKEYGSEAIEVADNGSAISPDNYQGLALKYHTSKLSQFSDLQTLTSFGFRGEALSSLCALADVTILTRTKDQQVGTRLKYDHLGHIVSQECAARPVGTTVYIEKLFRPLPVRHKEFTRNIRREYARMLSILQAYALISKNARLLSTNQLGKNRSHVFSTQAKGSVKENIVTVFGAKTVECLDPLSVALSDDFYVEGFISKPGSGSGRGSSDRQYFFLNGRPVEMPKVGKLLNELYRSFNSLQYPIAVLDFHLPTTTFDVNVTPDKRKVFLHSEGELLSGLREALTKLYAPEKYTFASQRVDEAPVVVPPAEVPSEPMVEMETEVPEEPEEPEMESAGTPGREESEMKPVDSPDTSVERRDFLLSYRCQSRSSDVPPPSRGDRTGGSSAKRVTVQGKITGFTTKRRSEDLLSEEPVLKRFSSSKHSASPLARVLLRKGTCSPAVLDELRAAAPRFDEPLEATADMEQPENAAGEAAEVSASEETNVFGGDPETLNPKPVFISPEDVLDEERVSSPALSSQEPAFSSPMNAETGSPMDAEMVSSPMDTECGPSPEIAEADPASTPASTPTFSTPKKVSTEEPVLVPRSARQGDATDSSLWVVSLEETVEPKNPSPKADPIDVNFDMEKLRARILRGLVRFRGAHHQDRKPRKSLFKAASVEAKSEKEKGSALAAATQELEKSFNKADFKRIKILGQFNLGFILAKLDHDIFIIDQHASDEKYNFERLSKSTVLNRQPLLKPLPLDLSAAEEITVSTHLETFKRNGFDFVEKQDARPGDRLKLSAVPFSKNTTFGIADVQELLSLVSDEAPGPQAHLVRPSRVRAMLASRACRSSIMIGNALSKKEMEKVVLHLADLDAPWNCPHGRPTMRHLVDLRNLNPCPI